MTHYKIQSVRNAEIYRIAFTLQRARELQKKMGDKEFKIHVVERPVRLDMFQINQKEVYTRNYATRKKRP